MPVADQKERDEEIDKIDVILMRKKEFFIFASGTVSDKTCITYRLWFSDKEHIWNVINAIRRINNRIAKYGCTDIPVRICTYGRKVKPKKCFTLTVKKSAYDFEAPAQIIMHALRREFPEACIDVI